MSRVAVKLIFADRGAFHDLIVHMPPEVLARHERIIDALREEPSVTAEVYIDMRRLVAAHVLAEGEK